MKLVLALLFIVAVTVRSEEVTNGGKSAEWRIFTNGYRPVDLKSLADVPSGIRSSVISHVRERVGDEFFKTLHFTGGQYFDLERLFSIDPAQRRARHEVPTYDLHFRFARPELGIAGYTAQIRLRADGSIVDEIDLPSFRAHPEKATLLSFALVRNAAYRSGMRGPIVRAEISYDREGDSLMWLLREITADDGLSIEYQEFKISAHTGAIASVRKKHAIR